MTRYVVTRNTKADFGDVKCWTVSDALNLDWRDRPTKTGVWQGLNYVGCLDCQTITHAMSRQCVHAKAVKRVLKRSQ